MILTSDYIVEAYPERTLRSQFLFFLSRLAAVKNHFKINLGARLKNFIISNLNKDFTKLLVQLEGISSVLDKEEVNITPEAYHEFDKVVSKYTKVYFALEKAHFFSDDNTKKLCNKIFTEVFSLESKIKQQAFREVKNNKDSSLLNEAAEISLSTASQYEPTPI